jgi:hypothetical protein
MQSTIHAPKTNIAFRIAVSPVPFNPVPFLPRYLYPHVLGDGKSRHGISNCFYGL